MTALVSAITILQTLLTLAGQFCIVFVGAALLAGGTMKTIAVNAVRRYALPFAFLVALGATVGSLFYSEIAGFTPCKLCWYQRIFMYPQVILLGLALKKRDETIERYATVLSLIGAFIAGFHYLLQWGIFPASIVSCGAIGQGVSCGERFFVELGYITIPLMAFTAFMLIALSFWLKRRYSGPVNGGVGGEA